MNVSRLLVLLGKEFREAVRNRTLLVVILLPLVASVSLAWLQREGSTPLELGVSREAYPVLSHVLPPSLVRLHPYPAADEEGRDDGGETSEMAGYAPGRARWDGWIEAGPDFAARLARGEPAPVKLVLNPQRPALHRMMAAQLPLVLAQLRSGPPLLAVEVEGLEEAAAGTPLLSVWITVTAVMIGVMIMGGNLAEERDKGTLLALVTTPASLGEILLAKACYGTLLITGMGALMLALHRIAAPRAAAALIALLPGALFFTVLGLLLGFLARNQATARSWGTLLYLPLLIPVFGHDSSPWLHAWAPYFPSYRLLAGLDAALSPGLAAASAFAHALWLLACSAAALTVAAAVMARRRF